MSALAVRTGAVNLGQGFPDTDGPAEIAEAAIAAIRAGHNQYPPGPGLPELPSPASRSWSAHESPWTMRVAAIQHDIAWEDPPTTLA
ncbi:MAG: hypothetical protein ACRDJP_03880, partial [Actinomycetota bacterium]